MKSVMQHSFSQVPRAEIPRSKFNRSHGLKTTFDAGYLVPVYVDEALPGDTVNMRANFFGRLATPIVPFMDNVFMDVFWFSCPIRLLWTNWEKFNGAQTDPGDSTSYLVPTMTSTAVTGYAEQSLHDYLGLPTKVPGLEHSSLWHRFYSLCYNQWFRDQNLQDSVVVDLDDGPDSPTDYVLLRRGKRHDYFTSCLPWPQKGTAVELPLGSTANVELVPGNGAGNTMQVRLYSNNALATGTPMEASGGDLQVAATAVLIDPNGRLYADLSTATASTINELREAFQVQRLYERDARGGTRYCEILSSHFGVVDPANAVLQRVELLGTSSTRIAINPVAQTSSTDGTSPQGNLAGYGVVSTGGHGFIKSFTEHCLLMGIVSVRADLNYQQGLNRMFSRSTRFDFYWPALAHLGEQAVLNKEIYAVGTGGASDDNVFGYNERWSEYKYKNSLVTGLMRSNATSSMDIWHLSQEFGALPTLNASFIVEDPPLDRVIATPSEPHMLLDCYFNLIAARPMPTYSVPGLIDHL